VDAMCFPWQQQSAQHRANKALMQLGFAFLSYLEQGARSLSVFYNCGWSFAGNHCLRIEDFSFSDKKKVLDVFDRHCWDAAYCIPTMFPAHFTALFIIPKFPIFYCQVFIFSSFS